MDEIYEMKRYCSSKQQSIRGTIAFGCAVTTFISVA